jgi:hypothetical protein
LDVLAVRLGACVRAGLCVCRVRQATQQHPRLSSARTGSFSPAPSHLCMRVACMCTMCVRAHNRRGRGPGSTPTCQASACVRAQCSGFRVSEPNARTHAQTHASTHAHARTLALSHTTPTSITHPHTPAHCDRNHRRKKPVRRNGTGTMAGNRMPIPIPIRSEPR